MKKKSALQNNTLDKYSMMIVSKYFQNKTDYLNVIQTTKKYQTLLDGFHYNPIPVETNQLFPHMETQHLYSKTNRKIPNMYKYIIWYQIPYKDTINRNINNIVFKNVIFTQYDLRMWKYSHPKDFDSKGNLIQINIPYPITSFGPACFSNCISLTKVTIPPSVKKIDSYCFYGCKRLTEVNIPTTVTTLENGCFSSCQSLVVQQLQKNM
ncbi:hypothetical protein QTN25_006411 [Entamoeba marina]